MKTRATYCTQCEKWFKRRIWKEIICPCCHNILRYSDWTLQKIKRVINKKKNEKSKLQRKKWHREYYLRDKEKIKHENLMQYYKKIGKEPPLPKLEIVM